MAFLRSLQCSKLTRTWMDGPRLFVMMGVRTCSILAELPVKSRRIMESKHRYDAPKALKLKGI
jgi:hypothetical protein